MNTTHKIILFLFLIPFFAFGQYPYLPQSSQTKIGATIGEERHNNATTTNPQPPRSRFHKGLDFPKTNGTEVYAIESGTAYFETTNSNTPCIGTYAYIHLDKLNTLMDGDFVNAGDLIGTVTRSHIHLQKYGSIMSEYVDVNSDASNWINPINNLTYLDSASPEIDAVQLLRHPGHTAIGTNILYGNLDILLNAEDPNIAPDGTADGTPSSAPHNLFWKLIKPDDTVLETFDGISFDNVPHNAAAMTVHGLNADWEDGNFEWYITDNPFNTPYDRYWNTLQKKAGEYNVNASCPEDLRVAEGSRFKIKGVACDFKGNCDEEYVNNQQIFTLDNFKPFIKEIEIKFKGETKYKGHWVCSGDCMKFIVDIGPLAYTIASAADANKFEVKATFSESMDNAVALKLTQGNVLGIANTSAASDNKVFTFSNIALKSGTFFLGEAKDLAGNAMIDMPAPNDIPCAKIPTRSSTGWNNPDGIPDGAEDNYGLHCPDLKITLSPTFGVIDVTHPTSCASSDGSIRTNGLRVFGAFTPYTSSSIVKDNGTGGYVGVPSFYDINIGIASNLAEGKYYLSVTDTKGCPAISDPIILQAPSMTIELKNVIHPCTGQTNGQVKAVVTFPTVISNFTFAWSHTSVVTTGRESLQQNLAPGTYTVTVSGTGGCKRVASVTLNSNNVSPPEFTYETVNPCSDGANGRITLNIKDYNSTFKINWDSPILTPPFTNGPTAQFNLGPGLYRVGVTNICGQMTSKTIELAAVGRVVLTKVENSDCTTDVQTSVANANPPLRYKWDHDANTNSTFSNVQYPSVAVTVTDALGCVSHASVSGVSSFRVSKVEPCAGTDGQFSIFIFNPDGKPMSASIGGISQTITSLNTGANPSPHSYSVGPFTGIVAGAETPITISIGSCTKTEIVTLTGKPMTRSFVGGNPKDGTCTYNLLCNGVAIKDAAGKNITFSQAGTVGFDATYNPPIWKFWKPKRCGNSLTCANLENPNGSALDGGFVGPNDMRKTTAGEYIAFLEEEKIRNPSNEAIIQHYINLVVNDINTPSTNAPNLNLCSKLTWCPTNYKVYGSATVNSKFNFGAQIGDDDLPKIKGNGCWEYKCGKKTVEACPPPPSGGVVITIPPISNCNPQLVSYAQLYVWEADMLVTYPHFKDSDLWKNYLEKNRGDKRTNCASVLFCANDFSVRKADNLNNVNCNSTTGPVKCEVLLNKYGNKSGIITCTSPWGKEGDRTIIVIDYEKKYAPRVKAGDGSTQILVNGSSTTFNNMAFVYDSENNTSGSVNGLIGSEDGNYYSDFLPHNLTMSLLPFGGVEFDIIDYDESTEIDVAKVNPGKLYTLNYENSQNHEFWSRNISAESLQITNLSKENEQITLTGYFIGDLSYNFGRVTTVDKASGFTMTVNYEGDILGYHIIEGVSETTSIFYKTEGGYNLSGSTTQPSVKVDGTLVFTSEIESLFNINISNKSVINQSSVLGNLKIHKIVEHTLTKEYYYMLYSRRGNTQTVVSQFGNITINPNEVLILAFNAQGGLKWHKKMMSNDIDVNKLDMIVDERGILYIGSTFSNSLTISDELFRSKGGKDIFLGKISPDGDLIGRCQYGSASDETVSKLYKSEDVLVLGGEILGSTQERQIGRTKFIRLSEVTQDAYMTYVMEEDFNSELNPSSKIALNTKSDAFDVKVYPNPFNENLFMQIDCKESCTFELSLINTLGSILWKKQVEGSKGTTTLEIDTAEQLLNGVYFLEIKTSEGKIITQRVVKN